MLALSLRLSCAKGGWRGWSIKGSMICDDAVFQLNHQMHIGKYGQSDIMIVDHLRRPFNLLDSESIARLADSPACLA